MFHDIPQPMLERMQYLEQIDTRERQDGTPRLQRLRQVPADTGRFLALMGGISTRGSVC